MAPTVTLINATLSGNYGGGIYHHFDEFLPDHVVTVRNSIVASNTGLNCFVDGGPTVVGNNLTTDNSCLGLGFVQVTAAQLNLGPLTFNGGRTNTNSLLPGSVAIDAGNQTECTADQVTDDQRGFVRDASCDLGAYEFGSGGLANLTLTIDVIPNALAG